jgi:hypothetical protein
VRRDDLASLPARVMTNRVAQFTLSSPLHAAELCASRDRQAVDSRVHNTV